MFKVTRVVSADLSQEFESLNAYITALSTLVPLIQFHEQKCRHGKYGIIYVHMSVSIMEIFYKYKVHLEGILCTLSPIRNLLFNFLADLKFPDFNLQAHDIVCPLKWTMQCRIMLLGDYEELFIIFKVRRNSDVT